MDILEKNDHSLIIENRKIKEENMQNEIKTIKIENQNAMDSVDLIEAGKPNKEKAQIENDVKEIKEESCLDPAIQKDTLNEMIDTAVDKIEGNDDDESNKSVLFANNIITKEMIEEEKRLEAEQKREMEQQMAEIQKQIEEEKCYKRLHLLLSKSNVFSKFMAEKFKTEEGEGKNKNKKGKKNHDDEDDQNISGKRKASSSNSPSKKRKCTINVMDVYKKENMSNLTFQNVQDNKPIEEVKSEEDRHPSLFYGGKMRTYQLEGYEWLKTLYENGVNGILADEMGLGKTIQSIAVIAYLIEMGVSGPFFVCGPLSTLHNWYSEFKRFTPDIPVVLYHGSKDERPPLSKHIRKRVKNDRCNCYPVVITSYQVALMDVRMLSKIEWKILVLDEAHRVKNFNCQLIQALRTYNSDNRLLLTGTPLQNNLDELWSLLNFILPEIFDDLLVFQTWFNMQKLIEGDASKEILAKEQEKKIVSTIHEILTPFLLRRTKADVELDLPPKKEVVVHAYLSSLQQKYYVAILNRSIAKLFNKDQIVDTEEILHKRVAKKTEIFGVEPEEDGDVVNISHVPAPKSFDPEINFEEFIGTLNLQMRNTSMLLRQVCNHPHLLYNPNLPFDESCIKVSGKLRLLDLMLGELKKRGHKVLIFSQFLGVLDILEDYCYYRNYRYCRLDGGMKLEARRSEMEDFKEENSFIFLISTRAGGLGINLATADTVIIYDSDWNPQSDLQAQDRCHRIGQTRPVVVYRYIVPNTVDERIFKFANAKRKLEKVILRDGRFKSKNDNDNLKPLTKEELVDLLKTVEKFDLVKADDENVLSPEELEKILDRSDMT